MIRERDSLLSCKVVNEQLVNTKSGTIKSLEKEKEIINLTIESDDLKVENEDLSDQNTDLKTTKEQLKTYLYTAIGIAVLLSLTVSVILQRRRISVQDVAIEEQLNDINKKNTLQRILRGVLEHIARHRTADIWKQKRGKTRDNLGMVYRFILEPICYVVGKVGR